jgi:hypothetical protein
VWYGCFKIDKFIANKAKKVKLGEDHLQKLRQIPCKYVSKGVDKCPFASGCFYLHLDKYGMLILGI